MCPGGGKLNVKIDFDCNELEFERQMHRYWHQKFTQAMFLIGLLGMPYIVAIISAIAIKISG